MSDQVNWRGRALQLLATPAGRALVALVLVLLLGAVADVVRDRWLGADDYAFFKFATHRDTLRQASEYGILACGMTLVIIAGGIDLSVGSVLALVAVCFSLFAMHWAWPAWAAVAVALLIGAACGAVSGTLAARFRIQPFIATLAMMVFARGLAKAASGGTTISTAMATPDGAYRYVPVPRIFEAVNTQLLGGGVSVVTLIFLVSVAVTWVFLARHRWGRHLYAIGGNEQAAWLSGIPVRRAKIAAYTACGVLAAVAGICHAAQEQQGDPNAGETYELTAIAIVVIGGTNLMGGRGGIGLTLIGTLVISYLDKVLSINAVPDAWRLMLTGAIIVLAVLAQRGAR